MNYGYCPSCNAAITSRTRGGANAKDTCENGHKHPSYQSLTEPRMPLPDAPPDQMTTIDQIMHGLVIFKRLNADSISSEHDIIYAGPDPLATSQEDIERLETLGWCIDYELNSFYHLT